ncbi:MAG: DUF1232 domain-containing protein [Gemmatimonadetes bacterium]|nr:DUF1232 domain-containing protein [Gemmatimonadota bacterium]
MKKINRDKLFDKIGKYAVKAGIELIYRILILYFTLLEPDVPAKAKAVILGALAYFISPIDGVPDILPGGLVDDAGAILAALALISVYVTEEIKEKARKQLEVWFGKDAVNSLAKKDDLQEIGQQ